MEDYSVTVNPRQIFFENLTKKIKQASSYYELEDHIDTHVNGDIASSTDKTFLKYLSSRFVHKGFDFAQDKNELISSIYGHIGCISKGSV